METPINAPPISSNAPAPDELAPDTLGKYGKVISGRTKDAELLAYLQSLGKLKARWIEAACYIVWQTEISKSVSIMDRAEQHRVRIINNNTQSQNNEVTE